MDNINPGIKKTVKWFNDLGYKTSDSGDGVTHDFECDRDYAYVTILLDDPMTLSTQADRIKALIEERGVSVLAVGEYPCIQADYDPVNKLAIIQVMGLSDKELFISHE